MATDIKQYLEDASNKQKAAALAAQKAAYNNALLDVNAAKTTAADNATATRTAASVANAQRQLADNEYAAGTGLSRGARTQLGMARQNVLGNAYNAADVAKQKAFDALELQRTKLGNQYNADVNSTAATYDAQLAAALANQMNADRSYDLSKSQADRSYALTMQQYENALKQQDRSDYASTATQYYQDYQKQIDAVLGDGDTSNDWQADILGALRQQKISALEAAKAEAAQQQFENQLAAAKVYNSGSSGGGGGGGYKATETAEPTYGGYTRDEIVKMVQSGMLSKEEGTAILSKPDGAGGVSAQPTANASPTATMSAQARQAYTLLNSPSADGTASQYTPAQKEQMLAIYLQRGAITEDEFIQLMQLSGLDPSKYMS